MATRKAVRSTWAELSRRGRQIIEGPGRRFVRLDEASLLGAACRRVGLRDFGDPSFAEPFRQLIQSIENEAKLNIIGRIGARGDLIQMLANRLRIERDRREHPEIDAEQIRQPLFITGLPRTGSTFLHGLLAEDPANRVPQHWETRDPSPPPERATYESDKRVDRIERQLRWFTRLAPEFMKIHQVGARQQEECVVLLSHSFLSYQFSSTYFVPSYQAFLDQQDLTPAYRFHRRFLQQLQWHYPGERWVLKAPPHLPGLTALFAVYPDARVVMTHRDPLEVLASVASLHAVLRSTFSDAVDPLAIGPEVTRMLALDINKGMQAREAGCAPAERFFDVNYEELTRDPLATAQRVYRHFGLPLTPDVEKRFRRYVAENPKDKFGAHEYSLEEFGLNAEEEEARYRPYRERFGL